jgi:hypothetical protein
LSGTPNHTDQPGAGHAAPLVLRVTLGDMPAEDALQLTLASTGLAGSLGELLEQAFPTSPEQTSRVLVALDLEENPDAREMHDELMAMLRGWRAGKCELRFFVGRHQEIALTDPIPQFRLNRLDLVVEQRYTPLEYAVGNGLWDHQEQLLDWLREQTALLISALADADFSTDSPLLDTARRIAATGRLEVSPDTGAFSITESGELALAAMAAEAESYFDRYNVFADVLYDDESENVQFGTGRGEDARVQVYEAEALDPVRVVFLLRMHDGSLEELIRDWQDAVGAEEFFASLLLPIVDHYSIDPAHLESIIEAGFARMDEQEETRESRAARSIALRRANAEGGC